MPKIRCLFYKTNILKFFVLKIKNGFLAAFLSPFFKSVSSTIAHQFYTKKNSTIPDGMVEFLE